jgi:hypothetical protein
MTDKNENNVWSVNQYCRRYLGILHREKEDKCNHENKGGNKSHQTSRKACEEQGRIKYYQKNKMVGITSYISV